MNKFKQIVDNSLWYITDPIHTILYAIISKSEPEVYEKNYNDSK
jgi:hypothetical protein